MKKLLFFSIIILLGCISLKAQYFSVDTIKLNNAEKNLVLNDSYENQKEFFDAFPENWPQYITTYQYSEEDGYNLNMYNRVSEQVNIFSEKLPLIDESSYCARVVNLAIGALIDADAPNVLQRLQHKIMKEKRNEMMNVISGLIEADQMLYWQFYWSSLYRKGYIESEYKELFSQLRSKYPEEMRIMSIAFEYFCGKSFFSSDNHVDGKKYTEGE